MSTKTFASNARNQHLWSLPSLKERLTQPLIFPSGKRIDIESMDFECGKCAQPIRHEDVHGSLTFPSANTAVMEAIGVCYPCQHFTCFDLRIHDDFRITQVRNGKWVQFLPEVDWVDRLWGFVWSLFKSERSNK